MDTLEAAQAALEVDRDRRARMAVERIQAILAELRCEIVAKPVIQDDGRLAASITVVAR